MFGYVVINKPELKFKEYDIYRGYYCGLCRSLRERHGLVGQMTLTYDMTFLALLLSALYEPEVTDEMHRCIAHPTKKQRMIRTKYTDYVADMNVLLSYYKAQDDWKDDHSLLKLAFSAMIKNPDISYNNLTSSSSTKKADVLSENNSTEKADILSGSSYAEKADILSGSSYAEKSKAIASLLDELSNLEASNETNIDIMSGIFGKIMSVLFVPKEDQWSETLRRMGFFLGKFIYILDAYEDVEDDIKKGRYNPFKDEYLSNIDAPHNEDKDYSSIDSNLDCTTRFDNECSITDCTTRFDDECSITDCTTTPFDDKIKTMLTMMMAECSKEFETLPILENVEILRNVLYAGVWTTYYNHLRNKEKR